MLQTTKSGKSVTPKDVEEYLAGLPEEPRATLEKLRQTIKSVAPEATEVISYQIPTIKLRGRGLVAFAAFKNHCSLFPMSMAVIRAHQDELQSFYTSKGTIRFTVGKPLPATLVKKLVKARIKENEARAKK
jgi:uncharacterized protein YdhG (YjbR/CyaY superfamily)